jgi:calcineurin-like phosphoesterase family protein
MEPVFVVGDVHGHRDVLVGLLRDAGLVNEAERWSGGDAVLWLVGDLVDRGPDGIGAIDLVRRLERESAGRVRCLLGNHEAFLLSVLLVGPEETGFPGTTFADVWLANGGVPDDLRSLTPDHVEWLVARPAIAREGEWLLLHADTDAYLAYGRSVDEVNARIAEALATGAPDVLDGLLEALCDRLMLGDPAVVDALLGAYGGSRIVHGHTPIASLLGRDPRAITAPLASEDGRVLNVDHCLFGGGPGFVTRLDTADAVAVTRARTA